jgi:hypothetical protein
MHIVEIDNGNGEVIFKSKVDKPQDVNIEDNIIKIDDTDGELSIIRLAPNDRLMILPKVRRA